MRGLQASLNPASALFVSWVPKVQYHPPPWFKEILIYLGIIVIRFTNETSPQRRNSRSQEETTLEYTGYYIMVVGGIALTLAIDAAVRQYRKLAAEARQQVQYGASKPISSTQG